MRNGGLSSDDREFFGVVSRAVFCNPFGVDRAALDRQLGRWGGGTSPGERAVARARRRVRELEAAGRADLRRYPAETAGVLRNVFAFDVFYAFRHEFGDLIRTQLRDGDKPSRVPFGNEAVATLVRRGFPEPFALHCFAIVYQMWRAFYFIRRQLVGACPSMRRLRFDLWNNVFTQHLEWYGSFLWERMEEYSTLLLGETGTGKGTAAAAIGRSGFIPYDPKRECFEESFLRNYTPLNLSQFPESLIESELFGHRKGAFTGAIGDHEGVFSLCAPYGSIFLDEIGDLSLRVQTKLLQVLQERTFCKVGSHERLQFRGRVIAATNKRLLEMRRGGQFRDDLYYRLCSNTITLPPLEQRFREDPRELDLLLGHLVHRMTGDRRPAVAEEIREVLRRDLGDRYPWPGNVRELEQAVRSVLLVDAYGGDAGLTGDRAAHRLHRRIERGDIGWQELVAEYCRALYERHGSYGEVSRRTGLDWRTVKKHLAALDARRTAE